ncbi:MAG: 4Fe-4S binding protein [Anaerolineae bacterium]|nr:4Fe-4S binding protein [Anaerolineae bacterium]
MAAVWLDETRCTGCGACVEVCPTGALTLVDGKAHLDEALCKGCEACIQACPAGALRPVLEIEAVPVATPVPEYVPPYGSTSVATSGSTSSPTNLLATVVAAGAQLAIQAAPLVLNTLGQLLLRPRGSKVVQTAITAIAGRQARHRWRGRS